MINTLSGLDSILASYAASISGTNAAGSTGASGGGASSTNTLGGLGFGSDILGGVSILGDFEKLITSELSAQVKEINAKALRDGTDPLAILSNPTASSMLSVGPNADVANRMAAAKAFSANKPVAAPAANPADPALGVAPTTPVAGTNVATVIASLQPGMSATLPDGTIVTRPLTATGITPSIGGGTTPINNYAGNGNLGTGGDNVPGTTVVVDANGNLIRIGNNTPVTPVTNTGTTPRPITGGGTTPQPNTGGGIITPRPTTPAYTRITVSASDTLDSLARKYNTSAAKIIEVNGAMLPANSTMFIPAGSGYVAAPVAPSTGNVGVRPANPNPTPAPAPTPRPAPAPDPTPSPAPDPSPTTPQYVRHIVKEGDTLASLAAQYNTTADAIRALNGTMLATNSIMYIQSGGGGGGGTNTATVTPTTTPGATAPQTKLVNVRQGDTIQDLARRHNTTVNKIMSLNNINDPDSIKAGDQIKVPA